MKLNKLMVLGIASIFLASFITVSASASTSQTISAPDPGDTLIYEVTTWQVPDILGIESGGAVTSSINLKGSELGLKILREGADSYEYGLYVKAGNGPITVTVSADELTAEFTDAFASFLTGTGDLVINVPAQTALPIVTQQEATFDIGSLDGPPFWIKNVNWAEVQTAAGSNPDWTYVDSGTGTVTLSYTQTNTDSEFTFEMSFAKASTDAVFSKMDFSGNFTDDSSTEHEFHVVLEYRETVNNPLPSGFDEGDVFVYKFTNVKLDIQYTLNADAETFIEWALQESDAGINNIETAVTTIESLVNDQKGVKVFQVKVLNIDGVMYDSEIEALSSPNPWTDTFNGFLLWGPGGPSPAVTPDWDLWNGLAVAGNAIANVYFTLLDVDTAGSTMKSNYEDLGLVSGPNFAFELSSSTSNGIVYHRAVSHTDLSWNVDNVNFDALDITIPSDVEIPPMTLDTTSDVSVGIAHSEDGYFLSAGLKSKQVVNFDINVPTALLTSIGTADSNQATPPIPDKIQGSVTVNLDVTLSLDGVLSEGVESSVVNKINEAEANLKPEFVGGIQTSPGFELPVVFISLVAIPVVFRKIKK